MKCHRRFDREILQQLSSKFVNSEFKVHRENVLFEREMAMMPSTQVYVNQELQRRENQQRLKDMQEEKREVRQRLYQMEQACMDLSRQIIPPLEQEKRAFTHKCSQPDCKGFLSTAWKCTICHKYTCSECNAPRGIERDDNHTCNEEDKKTMQLIKNDSKKCPGCAQYIFKVSGCDQMWCTSCHTTFSWRTGNKINGVIHNPHFYEFQRANDSLARELNDIPCGGMPTHRELSKLIRKIRDSASQTHINFLINMHRITIHIEETEMPRYEIGNIDGNNLDLRILYMLNEVSEPVFKQRIQQREKRIQKRNEIFLILQMFQTTMTDLFRQVILTENVETTAANMNALARYSNKSLLEVSSKYDCVVPILNLEEMKIITTKS
jgi:hypothetical protein